MHRSPRLGAAMLRRVTPVLRRQKSARKTRRSPSPPRTPASRSPDVSPSEATPAARARSPIPFHGFVSPVSSAGTPDARGVFSVSPAVRRHRGRVLTDYRSVVLDFCALSVAVLWLGRGAPPAAHLADFCRLLDLERIAYERLPASDPLAHIAVLLITPNNMHRLVCKMHGRLHAYVRD